MNFGPLAAEIYPVVWGTAANFNGFGVLAELLHVRHSSSGRRPNFAALNRGCHLYSARRPSRWALAHISSFFPRLISAVADSMFTILLYTWCGLSANLECMSKTCCTGRAENTGRKKSPKVAIWAPSHNFVWLYLRN